MSHGLYGHENRHQHIHLLTAIEMMSHRDVYDVQRPAYNDPIHDDRLLHDNDSKLLESVTTSGTFSEMMIIFATLCVRVQSYCPQSILQRRPTDQVIWSWGS